MNFTLVFLLLGLSSIFGEKCVVYKDYGSIPSLPKGAFYERYCRSVGGSEKQYCVEWDCPKTDCSYPIVPETGCPYCRGTCISQGKVQREGNSFRCADGCNTCTCHTSTIAMCYNRYPPKECRGYNEGKRTCDNGGRVFRENEHFTCADGCNHCTCHTHTWIGCTFNLPPEIYRKNETL